MSQIQNLKPLSLHSESQSPSIELSGIKEVFRENLLEEIKKIRDLISDYPVIGMDTEFPGSVYNIDTYTESFYYETLKLNVDNLKLIQLGITLSKSNGDRPEGTHTWQFNFQFDPKKDNYNEASFDLLQNSGIDFKKMKKHGISHLLFAEYLMSSGLVLNPEVMWISFHGSYDFAYILKYLMNQPLPQSEFEFTETLGLYFPNHYDIKILIQNERKLQGGLNRLANYLKIMREGNVHQAGSDSIVTIDVYFSLLSSKWIDSEEINGWKNILYGLGFGADDSETITYTQFTGNLYNYCNDQDFTYYPKQMNMYSNMDYSNHIKLSKSRSTSGSSSLDNKA